MHSPLFQRPPRSGASSDSQEDVFSMRRFELIEGTASKFWEVEQAGHRAQHPLGPHRHRGPEPDQVVRRCRQGRRRADQAGAEKAGKGYSEVGVAAGSGHRQDRGEAEGRGSAEKARPRPAATPRPRTATEAIAAPAAAAPAESIDSQADRVFEAVRAQIEAGTLTARTRSPPARSSASTA
jgi:hypothetical protein